MTGDSTPKPAANLINNIFADIRAPQTSFRHALYVLLFFSILFAVFFSPVIFHGQLLAPGGSRLGDGLLSHLAYYLSPKIAWDPLLANGFPMTADSQAMSWYPPSLILSQFPGTWNIFVISAFVLAACFAYGYVYTLTESRAAALLSGITYSMCGFMFAHLGHTAMIHTAAWLPLIVWSLEKLRRGLSRFWLAAGCAGVACCVLAGHLQIVLYTLIVGGFYALFLGRNAPAGRSRFYAVSLLLFLLGLGLAGLQILPTAELAGFSTRTDFAFSDFVSYSLPFKQIPLLLFPAAFGGLQHYGTTPYFGDWNLTEMTGYMGLLPLMLAGVGLFVSKRQGVSIFWLCVAVIAFVLTLGERTPLASLIFHLPVISRFRVPARHFIELSFAVSVLAGLGAQAILKRKVSLRLLFIVMTAGALLMAAGALVINSESIARLALERGVAALNARPWVNSAVGTPLVIFLLSGAILLFWQRAPASFFRSVLLGTILIADLASFGWFFTWHDYAPRKEVLDAPVAAAKYGGLLNESHQRMISIRGTLGTLDELPPNLSRVWNVPNATGYGPLLPSRVLYLLSILPDGSIAPTWKNAEDQSLNLASVRYVFVPQGQILRDLSGTYWADTNMDIWLGAGCDHPERDSVRFVLPKPFKATGVAIVSRLACSTSVQDGEEVARVSVTDDEGEVQTASLVAGRDSSEWAYDCPEVKTAHARANVFGNFPASMHDQPCAGHFYVARLPLPEAANVNSLKIQWTGHTGAITIEKVSLLGEADDSSEPVSQMALNNTQWSFVERLGDATIYENLRANPRAWLVPEAVNLKPEEILSAVKTSRLPDGREFDTARTALVEGATPFHAQNFDPEADARITRFTDRLMEVQTSAASQSFLVTSDLYYPGWGVTIDDTPAQLLRTDYAFRGVAVPAGNHVVRFEFTPKTFSYGLGVSALSLIALAGFLARAPYFRRPTEP